jgi:hypothetical protein
MEPHGDATFVGFNGDFKGRVRNVRIFNVLTGKGYIIALSGEGMRIVYLKKNLSL